MKLDIQLFAVPFRKTSKTRKRMRRTHYKISANEMTTCPKCGATIKPHRVCKNCGTYKVKKLLNRMKKKTNSSFFWIEKQSCLWYDK